MIPAPVDDPVVARYRALFAQLEWSVVPERDPARPWPGSPPHPRAAYIKALLIKVCEGFPFLTHLRTFLVEHPRLVHELGFRLAPDPTAPHGFDVERTVPGVRWLRHQQQTLDHAVLRALLARTVTAAQAIAPTLGTTVAIDVKHIYAWVRENNPKEEIPHRFDPHRQPAGDPDCRLGVKRRANRPGGRGTKTYVWGYGTGLATAIDPVLGDVVLGEVTQPFHHQDVTSFAPVYAQTVTHLGHPPTNLTADAAFDAWSVYQPCASRGGIAAIARNRRGAAPPRDAAGHPICAAGLSMVPTSQFRHEDGYQAQRYRCPLLVPQPTGTICPQPQFATGRGCHKAVNIEPGGRMRAELDRTSAAYRALYRQRTSAERINSQAVALGIEHPRVRRGAAVARLNTLTYIVINARVLLRYQRRHPTSP